MSAVATIVDLIGSADSPAFIKILCALGVAVCYYAIHVETEALAAKKNDKKYIPWCSIFGASCTRALTSDFSHMTKLVFGLKQNSIFNYSNAQYGLAYYLCLLIANFYPFTMFPYHKLIFFCFTFTSVLASLGLGYILARVLKTFCTVCVTMYVINSLLMVSAVVRFFH